MARFNETVRTKTEVKNLAGGHAYSLSDKLKFVTLMTTTFLKDQFYRTATEQLNQIVGLVEALDKKFVAKVAIYARTKFYIRSATHVVAAELARLVKGEEWTKRAIAKIMSRPDDVTETLAYYLARYGKPIPNSLKKGLGLALLKFDEYQIGKYKAANKDLSLVDVVNLIHPPYSEAIDKLMKGTLDAPDTWEVGLSKAGQSAETEEEVKEAKEQVWDSLLESGKIGYMALIRNLRNILSSGKVHPNLISLITDPDRIKGSKMFPYRFYVAYETVKHDLSKYPEVLAALRKATDISVDNVPVLEGKTLIAVDTSGSMGRYGDPSSYASIACLFAAALVKRNPNSHIMVFSSTARYLPIDTDSSVLTIADTIAKNGDYAGTSFGSALSTASFAYDRIIFLSDMQGWLSYGGNLNDRVMGMFSLYKSKYKCDPYIYSVDIAGYGSSKFPEPTIYLMSGFSEKIFDVMKMMEEDREAMITEIESISFD